MSDPKDAFLDWQRWGAFRIPFTGVIVLTLLLLVGSLTNIEKAYFVQKVVVWVIGAGVIAYGHSLAHSTQKNWQGKESFKDLSLGAQITAMFFHVFWLCFFVFTVFWL